MIHVGINGFGRMGRAIFRINEQNHTFEIVDNTPDKIVDGIKKMLLYVKRELILIKEKQKMQDSFKSLFP